MDCCTIRRLNGESLRIVRDSETEGLFMDGRFQSDREISDFIQKNLETASLCAVNKITDKEYVLNIKPKENSCALSLEGEILSVRKQTETYMPIIKYFLLNGFGHLPFLS